MKNKILDPRNLPYAGAVVQAVLFAIAGDLFFPSAFGWLAGLGVGAVVNYSLALASSRISDVSEKRKPMARLALIAMFLLSPATITLSMFAPKSVFAAISWSVCVDLSIILAGAIAGKSLIPQATPQKKTSNGSTKSSGRSAKGAGRSKPLSKAAASFACQYAPQCDRSFQTQNAANAHGAKCGFKPLPTMLLPNEQKVEKSA